MRSPDYLPLSVYRNDAGYVYSHRRGGFAPPGLETGKKENPPGRHPGDSLATLRGSARVGGHTKVVASGSRVPEESREHGPADDVGTPLGALAVTDRDNVGQVGGHLYAAAVLVAPASLPPNGLRQVSHGSLQLVSELPEIDRGVGWLQRAIDRFFERLDVPAHLIGLAHLHDREVGFGEGDARLPLGEVEDVDR